MQKFTEMKCNLLYYPTLYIDFIHCLEGIKKSLQIGSEISTTELNVGSEYLIIIHNCTVLAKLPLN